MARVLKNDGSPSSSDFQRTDVLSPAAMTALTAAHLRLFKQIERVNRMRTEGIEEVRRSEAELGLRLLRCSAGADAVDICKEWMLRRAAHFVAENHRIVGLWMDFANEVANEASDGE